MQVHDALVTHAIRSGVKSPNRGGTVVWVVLGVMLVVAWGGCRRDASPASMEANGVPPQETNDLPTGQPGAKKIHTLELGLESALANADVAIAKAIRAAAKDLETKPNSADAWGKLAMLLSAHDMKEVAAQCFQRAAELEPDETRWPYLRGRALALIDLEAAILALKKAVEVNQDQITNPRLQLAELLLEQGSVDDASAQIRIVLQKHTNSDRARLLMARAKFLKGDWQACLESLSHFRGEPNKKVFILAAESQQRLGNRDEAHRLRVQADNAEDYGWGDPYVREVMEYRTGLKVSLNQADELFGAGKYEKSIRLLESVIADYPESDWAKILLGRAFIRTQRYSEAEEQLRAALALAPGSVEALFRLGVVHFRQEQLKEATIQFRKAIRLKPDFTMAYYNLSFCQEKQGDISGAIKSMRRCVQCEPEYVQGWHRLALLAEKNGDKESSRDAYGRALSLDPENATIREQMRLLDVDSTVDPSDLDF